MDGRISGLTALDPRVAATEQFIQKNKIPPEQVPQFLLSMGADPRLAGLVMKYQRLKQEASTAPQGPPPSTTVAQDIDMQLQGGQPPQPSASPATPASPAPPMQQGIGGLPAPVMDNAEFAGGGIVAFSGEEGSFVQDGELQEAMRTPRDMRTSRQNEIIRRAVAEKSDSTLNPTVVAPTASQSRPGELGTRLFVAEGLGKEGPGYMGPGLEVTGGRKLDSKESGVASLLPTSRRTAPTSRPVAPPQKNPFDMAIQEQQKRTFTEAPDTYSAKEEARIKAEQAKMSGDDKFARNMALARAGFGMAAAASRRGAEGTTFLGALSEGAMGGINQYTQDRQRLKEIDRELNKQMSSLAQYRDQVAQGNIKERRGFEESVANNISNLQVERYKTQRAEAMHREQMSLERAKLSVMRDNNLAEVDARAKKLLADAANDAEKSRISKLRIAISTAADNLKSLRDTGADSAAIEKAAQTVSSLMNEMFSTSGSASGYEGDSDESGTSDLYSKADAILGG